MLTTSSDRKKQEISIFCPSVQNKKVGIIPSSTSRFLYPLLSTNKLLLEGNIHSKFSLANLRLYLPQKLSRMVASQEDAKCWKAVFFATKKKLPFSLEDSNGSPISFPTTQELNKRVKVSKSLPGRHPSHSSKRKEEFAGNGSNKRSRTDSEISANSHLDSFWRFVKAPVLSEMEPSNIFVSQLRSYQKQALCWMSEREKNAGVVPKDSSDCLAKGWKEERTEEGKIYYVHPTQGTTWEKPHRDEYHMASTARERASSFCGGILADDM